MIGDAPRTSSLRSVTPDIVWGYISGWIGTYILRSFINRADATLHVAVSSNTYVEQHVLHNASRGLAARLLILCWGGC